MENLTRPLGAKPRQLTDMELLELIANDRALRTDNGTRLDGSIMDVATRELRLRHPHNDNVEAAIERALQAGQWFASG